METLAARIILGDGVREGSTIVIDVDLSLIHILLISGEDEAKAMGDEYVSVEHLSLSLLKHPNKEIKALFKLYNITRAVLPPSYRSSLHNALLSSPYGG